jgi:hypothetical protein
LPHSNSSVKIKKRAYVRTTKVPRILYWAPGDLVEVMMSCYLECQWGWWYNWMRRCNLRKSRSTSRTMGTLGENQIPIWLDVTQIQKWGAEDSVAPTNIWRPTCKNQPTEVINIREFVCNFNGKEQLKNFISLTPLSLMSSKQLTPTPN